MSKQTKYIPGMKFNMLTLIRPTGEIKNHRKVWLCQCECGNYTEISTANIKSTKSCGCLKGNNKIKINIGDKFGKLIVLEEIPERDASRRVHYKCQCECGNITTPSASDLKNGHSTSCGKCSPFWDYAKFHDLKNQRFGKLIAIKPILNKKDECYKNNVGRSMFWLCKCDCGNYKKISANHLTQGKTTSCGCQLGTISKGEQEIIDILNKNKVSFKTEVTFPNLKAINLLRFDFGIIDSDGNILRLIEFDGELHYSNPEFFTNAVKIQNNDIIKNEYCKNNNIPLVRIPYWERGKITLEMILGDEYLI